MKQKVMKLQPNERNGGIDLLIERDSGNEFLVLMGRKELSLLSWKRLVSLGKKAIKQLTAGLIEPDEDVDSVVDVMTPQNIGWEQNSAALLKMFGISDPNHHLKKIIISVDFVIGAKPGEKNAK